MPIPWHGEGGASVLSNFKLKPLLTLGFIFIFLTTLRLLWVAYHYPPKQPLAHDGVLDLQDYDLSNDQTITLNGEWAFIPNTFISPDLTNGNVSNMEKTLLRVPFEGEKNVTYQFGTYRLRILLDGNQGDVRTFGIRLPSAKTASALFINGRLKARSGTVADNPHEHKGEDIPSTVFFSTDQQEIDIILHISNFDTPESTTINKTITFGMAEAIIKEESFIKNLITMIVVVLILHSIYSLLIYFFIYRHKMLLFFTVGFLFPAIDEVLIYDKGMLSWLHLDYDWSMKLGNLIYLGSSFFFVQLMRMLLEKHRNDQCFRWFTILYGLCALTIIALPTEYLVPANALFFIVYFLSFITILFLALKEYFHHHKESFFLAFVTLSTTSGIIWGLIKVLAKMEIPFYPFDYIFAFLGFAIFWFKQYHKKNKQAAELVHELQKADTLKDEFLKNSSKKLRTPLNEMIIMAQTIYDGKRTEFAKQDKDDLKYLINMGRSMSFMLADLLDYTRLKERTIQINPQSTNIHGSVSGVFDMLRFISEGKQVQMISTIPSSFPNVYVDENRLIQILFNLLHNAIKYTHAGKIVIDADVRDNMAVIHVQDSGQGMDEETQKRILAPYEQGEPYDTGLGLGLNVCKQLIELHGGTLQVESVLRKGSDFFFTLPLAKKENVANMAIQSMDINESAAAVDGSMRKRQNHMADSKKHYILVVDDDPVTLKVISNLFPANKYDVLTVISGKEALDMLDKVEWDLIIIDAIMPHISGYELTRLIREKYSALELPILLLPARNDPEDVYTAFSLGANDYVTKPIHSLELKSRVRALIDFKDSANERLYMEAAWLQAQIQPHFLFNTLNTIASLSEIDSERMINLLNTFGEYLRGSFNAENLKRLVPLNHELELVRSYLYIQKERFGDRLQIKWEVDENEVFEVPPLSIQPLVENAVRHGVMKRIRGGTVEIRIENHPTFTTIAVADDGVGISKELMSRILNEKTKIGSGIGLINTNRRLKRIYGHGLEITSSVNHGTEVKFNVPKLE